MAEIMGKTTSKKPADTTGAKSAEKKIAVAKKPVADKAAAKKASPAIAAENTSAVEVMDVSAEQRYRMVAEAAYYRAESNQFMSDPVRDWIEAESDIAALLGDKK